MTGSKSKSKSSNTSFRAELNKNDYEDAFEEYSKKKDDHEEDLRIAFQSSDNEFLQKLGF